jgi:hypothetical protein
MARFLVIVNILSAFFNNTPLVRNIKLTHYIPRFKRCLAGCYHDADCEGLGAIAQFSEAGAPAASLRFFSFYPLFLSCSTCIQLSPRSQKLSDALNSDRSSSYPSLSLQSPVAC